MTNLKKPQIVTILVAVVAIVLLFMLPRTEEGKVEESVASIEQSDDYRFAALEALNEADKNTYLALESKYSASSDPLNQIEKLDSMSHFWEEKGDLLMAADELFKAAEIISDVPSYMIAGDKYFEAFQNSQGERIELALNKSIKCYELILEKDPDQLKAMTSLGVCYVEGSAALGQPPMKGIGILKNVLEKDPNNIDALINLGYFSAKSGQFDKAVERFKLVLEIDPQYSDAYLYLSDVYLQMKNNEEAANYLEKFKPFVEDPQAKAEIEIYIEQLRNKKI